MTDDHTCPRCGGGIPNNTHRGQYPGALSRYDNKTMICSACGTDEALSDMLGTPLTGPADWAHSTHHGTPRP